MGEGALLSLLLLWLGFAGDRFRWLGLTLIIAGLATALVAAGGLHFAPAYDQGALSSGAHR